MAYKFAIANGNWSDGTTWSEGTVPLSGDTVYTNGFTVTIDQNINIASIKGETPFYYLQNQIIPVMTSNVLPSGLADASTNTNIAFQAFDDNPSTYWKSGIANSGILSYKFDTAKTIRRYFFSKSSLYSPKNFTFEASNDGTNWTILETVVNDTSTIRYVSGDLANTTAYLYYRLNVTANVGNYETRIYRFEMSEEGTTNVFGANVNGVCNVNDSKTIIFNGEGLVGRNTLLAINSNSPDVVNLTTVNNGYILGPNCQIVSADCTILRTYGSAEVNYIGDVYGARTSGVYTRTGNFYIGGSGTVNIIGNVYGTENTNAGYNNIVINVAGVSSVVNITGNVYGGTGSQNYNAIMLSSGSGTLNITGNLITPWAACVYISSNGVLNHTGIVQTTSISSKPAVVSFGTGIHKFTSPFINYGGTMAISVWNMKFYSGSTVQWLFQDTTDTDFNLYSANVTGSTLGLPLTTDVRSGVSFGSGNALTGTLVVPSAANVRKGVPVDLGVGTAELTAEDFLNAITGSTNPIAVRLKNVATVDTVGSLFTSFNP